MKVKHVFTEAIAEVTLYKDDSTGIVYYYNGTELIPLPSTQNSSPTIGKPDSSMMDDEEAQWDAEETEEERNARVQQIKDRFSDEDTADMVKSESTRKKQASDKKAAEREAARYKSSGIESFKISINNFIKNEIKEITNKTWSKLNKKYGGTDIIRPGISKHKSGQVPSINVYFDQSGSWDAEKIAVGQNAIASLNKYVNKGLIKIYVYYFANEVGTRPNDDRYLGGGTRGIPIVEHIKQTKPDNVVIMTDSDISDIRESITVKGGVWLLFKGYRETTQNDISTNLVDSIHGKKLTKLFLI